MPICSSGTSGPRAGVASSVYVDRNYVQSLLPTALQWLYPFLPYMQALEIGSVSAFCGSDPPSWTVPTPLQFLNFVTGGPLNDFLTVNDFIQDVVRYYLWFQLCQCNSVSTPSAGSGPSAPTGLPAINPPSAVSPSVGACAESIFSGTIHNTDLLHQEPILPLPQGCTSATLTSEWTISSTTSGAYQGGVTWLSSAGATLGSFGVGVNTGSPTLSASSSVPSGTTQYRVSWGPTTSATSPTSVDFDWQLQFFCGSGSNGGPVSVPCPPDPYVIAQLNQILQLVTLLQRQVAPFSYIDGTAHTGLTGSGEITVQGLLGVRVLLTSIPSNVGVDSGDPLTYWRAGWIRFGNSDGFAERKFIDASPMTYLPPLAGQYTRIGYTLTPGVTATITEISREP